MHGGALCIFIKLHTCMLLVIDRCILSLIERKAYVCIMYEFEVPFLLSVDMHYRIDFPRKLPCMKSVAKNDLATFNNISQSLIHMLCYVFHAIKTGIKWYI